MYNNTTLQDKIHKPISSTLPTKIQPPKAGGIAAKIISVSKAKNGEVTGVTCYEGLASQDKIDQMKRGNQEALEDFKKTATSRAEAIDQNTKRKAQILCESIAAVRNASPHLSEKNTLEVVGPSGVFYAVSSKGPGDISRIDDDKGTELWQTFNGLQASLDIRPRTTQPQPKINTEEKEKSLSSDSWDSDNDLCGNPDRDPTNPLRPNVKNRLRKPIL